MRNKTTRPKLSAEQRRRAELLTSRLTCFSRGSYSHGFQAASI